jgi:amino acid adenylation domain-containing protein
LLRQVREVCLEAYDHQDLPFERLVQELQPERNLSHAPVIQVMFAFERASGPGLMLPGLRVTRVGAGNRTAKFDLSLSVVEGEEGYRAGVEYNPELFDGATIKRMLDHYRTLLEGIADNPDRRISLLPLLTECERHKMLVTWNDTRRDYPGHLCVHELFEAQARRSPDAVAAVFKGQSLTYRELNAQANQLARHLRKLGVGPEVRVGLCVERSLEMVIGHLGILKSGGAFVPLAPSQPKERLAFMLEDTGAPVWLTQEHLTADLPGHEARAVCLDSDWDGIQEESRDDLVNTATPENLAYVTYTSGSTGRPKGVQIRHSGLCNVLLSSIQSFGLTATSRVALIGHFGFDNVTWECFMALLAGATLYVGDERDHLTGRDLSRWLRKSAITTATIIPSVLNTLADEALPSLKTLITGAETVSREVVARWSPDRRLFNTYGPTEVSISATVLETNGGSRRPPIGRPIANTDCYILDRYLQPVPIGVHGELYLGGIGLARGYMNRPDLTAQSFVPHPFSGEPGRRLYRTGDLCRYLPDGNIDFLGRIDQQVKMRGFRVELGAIELALTAHEGVEQSAVLAWDQEGGGASAADLDRHLVAYVVPATQPPPSVTELRRYLSEKLPRYMVPSRYVILTEMPSTSTGKVDRRALPPPEQRRPGLDVGFLAPRTPMEKTLAGIWQDVLGVEKVGVHDDFFDLGGHSLLATRVVSRLRGALHVELPLRRMFEGPTVARLAVAIEEHKEDAHSVPSPIEPVSREVYRVARAGNGAPPVIDWRSV